MTTALLLALYVAPIVVIFALAAAVADYLEAHHD